MFSHNRLLHSTCGLMFLALIVAAALPSSAIAGAGKGSGSVTASTDAPDLDNISDASQVESILAGFAEQDRLEIAAIKSRLASGQLEEPKLRQMTGKIETRISELEARIKSSEDSIFAVEKQIEEGMVSTTAIESGIEADEARIKASEARIAQLQAKIAVYMKLLEKFK